MGFPLTPNATQGERFGIVVFLAPIVEELVFGFILILILTKLLKLNFWIANIISAAAFAMFHLAAYGSSFTLQGIVTISGALIGAGIFRLIANIFINKEGNPTPGIIGHAIYNFYQITTKLVIIGGV